MPRGEDVRRMFDRIVRRYDLLNHLLSLGLDRLWVRALARAWAQRVPPAAGRGKALDLCCGTGDIARGLLRCYPRLPLLVAADFSLPMCRAARAKLARRHPGRPHHIACADALRLPFPDRSFDLVTVAFGLRNFEDMQRGLVEIRRVLAPGGLLAALEFAPPRGLLLKTLYRPYLHLVPPLVGGLLARDPGGAYSYLARSIEGFLEPERVVAALVRCGFEQAHAHPLTMGITTLCTARRP